ncbi:hypothetical protein BSL78_06425 [Apostichopus japonicus]|uniref:Uncharacterized protein n=1 Tax=Stichopus japonicus TaxID=307972 RepID=A0A2G8L8Q2_STIJA|nr:hypothetical protein BSL78_06425 [Apostichopus japonicus]
MKSEPEGLPAPPLCGVIPFLDLFEVALPELFPFRELVLLGFTPLWLRSPPRVSARGSVFGSRYLLGWLLGRLAWLRPLLEEVPQRAHERWVCPGGGVSSYLWLSFHLLALRFLLGGSSWAEKPSKSAGKPGWSRVLGWTRRRWPGLPDLPWARLRRRAASCPGVLAPGPRSDSPCSGSSSSSGGSDLPATRILGRASLLAGSSS